MTSKRSLESKCASLPWSSACAKAFVKDWDGLSRSGRFDMNRLKAVMILLIANDPPLAPEWLDHALRGAWADHRECHVGGDSLLIYQVEANLINFVRAGTHADLFNP